MGHHRSPRWGRHGEIDLHPRGARLTALDGWIDEEAPDLEEHHQCQHRDHADRVRPDWCSAGGTSLPAIEVNQ
jgi:hypothetical protein